ncbi:MAG: enoyl-CoA hydratase-related protein [Bacteroidales bacterium]|jgi:methylglutaconyl-CoA hydratase
MEKLTTIQTSIRSDTIIITLNRPQIGNAINMTMLHELKACVEESEANSELRFIILKASGRSFCSGADLNWMAGATDLSFRDNLSECKELAALFRKLFESEKILIAQVQGPCIGGGMGLLAVSDFVYATANSFFSFSEVKLGLVPATIAPFITRRISHQKAKTLMLSGVTLSAAEAVAEGIADRLTDESKLSEEVGELMDLLRKGGVNAQTRIKQLFRDLRNLDNADRIDHLTANLLAEVRISTEGREGISAYLEKRKPGWNLN